MKKRKAFSVLMLCMGLSLILPACGRNENAAEDAYRDGEGISVTVEENTSKQSDSVISVEKAVNDTVIVSFENDILGSMKDGSEIWIRFYYDGNRSGGV